MMANLIYQVFLGGEYYEKSKDALTGGQGAEDSLTGHKLHDTEGSNIEATLENDSLNVQSLSDAEGVDHLNMKSE